MNVPIIVVATVFWMFETHYFGWNMNPQSDAELICDGIVAVIFAMAFIDAA